MMTFIQLVIVTLILTVTALGSITGVDSSTPASWECPDPVTVKARLEAQPKLTAIADRPAQKSDMVIVEHGVGPMGAPAPRHFPGVKAISASRPRPPAVFYPDFHPVDDLSPDEMASFLVDEDDLDYFDLEAGLIAALNCRDLFSIAAVLTAPLVLGLMFA